MTTLHRPNTALDALEGPRWRIAMQTEEHGETNADSLEDRLFEAMYEAAVNAGWNTDGEAPGSPREGNYADLATVARAMAEEIEAA